MGNYWVSWYADESPFTLVCPWWYSGYRVMAKRLAFDETWDQPTLCAAMRAADENEAKEAILACHDDRPKEMEWRFCNVRPDDWSPFDDRFQKKDWMRWPVSAAELASYASHPKRS